MHENLALAYQEVFTAIDRLRGGRQTVADATGFRQQIRDATSLAEGRARSLGYSGEDIRLATFALLALLDETVLSLRNPVFHDWPRKPMQEEFFGTFHAGEIFFTNVQRLLQGSDSAALADVLEVYQLCLLLGFQGRHSAERHGELAAVRNSIAERITRIRGIRDEISPAWKLLATEARNLSDTWLRPLVWVAAGAAVITVLLFVIYSFLLHSGNSELAMLASWA